MSQAWVILPMRLLDDRCHTIIVWSWRRSSSWLAQRYTLSELQLRWHQTPLDFSEWSQVTLPEMKDYQTCAKC